MSDISKGDVVDTESVEKEVKAQELGESLGIAGSTVRKYAKIFEDKGYKFRKNHGGHWVFLEKDYEMFADMLNYKNKAGIGLEQAVDIALSRHQESVPYQEGASQLTQSVRPLTEQEKRQMEMQHKFDEMIKTFEDMSKGMMTKEQGEELKQENQHLREELSELKSKLDVAVGYIENQQQQEEEEQEPEEPEVPEEEPKEEKKGLFSRLFKK